MSLLVINVVFFFLLSSVPSLAWTVPGISLLLLLLVVFFFRKPYRQIAKDHSSVIAPADGLIVAIEEVDENEYYRDKRLKVSIFMSMLDIHVNLCPISGKVAYSRYHPGKYMVALHPKSSLLNERTTTVIENAKHSLLVRQIAGGVARRVVTYPTVGNHVEQGEELGFIKFGSRVDLYLPLSARVKVKIRKKVRAGKTVLATLS